MISFTVVRLPLIVMRGPVPRTYPWRRPDRVAAPNRVGPRVKPEGDDVRAPA